MLDTSLIHPKEKSLKPVVYVFSIAVWAMLACTLIGLCYGLALLPFVLMAHAYFLGHVRGAGVRVDERQLPDLHRRVVAASHRLGLSPVPEVYVLQSGGALNAFATKLLSRTYVILFSELLDKCNSDQEVDFVVAHELAHHAAGHLKSMLLTAPARLVPLLGPAYSRACEYTCDRAALAATDSLDHGQRALAVLAAGSKAGAQLDLGALGAQQETSAEFWPAVAELGSSHPYLPKRVAMLAQWSAERSGARLPPPAPARPFFAYVLAIFVGRQAAGMVGAAYLVIVLAVLAAIAIPNYMKFRERTKEGASPTDTSGQRFQPNAAPSSPESMDEAIEPEQELEPEPELEPEAAEGEAQETAPDDEEKAAPPPR